MILCNFGTKDIFFHSCSTVLLLAANLWVSVHPGDSSRRWCSSICAELHNAAKLPLHTSCQSVPPSCTLSHAQSPLQQNLVAVTLRQRSLSARASRLRLSERVNTMQADGCEAHSRSSRRTPRPLPTSMPADCREQA